MRVPYCGCILEVRPDEGFIGRSYGSFEIGWTVEEVSAYNPEHTVGL